MTNVTIHFILYAYMIDYGQPSEPNRRLLYTQLASSRCVKSDKAVFSFSICLAATLLDQNLKNPLEWSFIPDILFLAFFALR